MAKVRTTQQEQKQFEDLVSSLENWVIKQTVLRMEEMATEDMRSPSRRQALAEEINQDSRLMLESLLQAILRNQLGRPILKPLPSVPGLILPPYANLSPRQRKDKTRKEPRRPLPSFFLHKGVLVGEQLGPLLEQLRLHLNKDHIRVYRVTARVVAVPTTNRNGQLHYRSQVLNIDASGRGTKAKLTSGWTIDMVLPPGYAGLGKGNFFDRNSAPERQLTGDESILAKLQNWGKGSSRPYRPLLGPYLAWFREEAIPYRIKKRYSAKK